MFDQAERFLINIKQIIITLKTNNIEISVQSLNVSSKFKSNLEKKRKRYNIKMRNF